MLRKDVMIDRPKRWDVPFGPTVDPSQLARLLVVSPFSEMDPDRFLPSCSLPDILRNDCRINRYQAGDLIVREGDYGNSAFMILHGTVRVALTSLSPAMLGRQKPSGKSFFGALAQLFTNHKYPEARTYHADAEAEASTGQRQDGEETRVFLQDVPGVLSTHRTLELKTGEVFGEVAALSRTPRTATIFAMSDDTELLEIRWQGLREFMKRDPALQNHIHSLYRENSLKHHLRETPILKEVSPEDLERIVAATQFETYGSFDWHTSYKSMEELDVAERIKREPVIANEGHYADGLILIRSGFARLSHQYGNGHRTIRYLGKGDAFGMEELAYAWRQAGPEGPSQVS
ncbi:MAG: cyclic nucleotide-binding domain-containing protein, partial [Planctomycetales bacterium]|nr:cyclic nucleotide-binding domain-containing protein [Planctomycetales bacterium]